MEGADNNVADSNSLSGQGEVRRRGKFTRTRAQMVTRDMVMKKGTSLEDGQKLE